MVGRQVVPKYGPCGVDQLKPRMMRAVASLGPADVQKILQEQGLIALIRFSTCQSNSLPFFSASQVIPLV